MWYNGQGPMAEWLDACWMSFTMDVASSIPRWAIVFDRMGWDRIT